MAEKTTKLSESLNLSVSQAGLDNLTMSESKKDQLKAAFLLFCKREFNQATGKKKHALKRYEHFTLNTSCFLGKNWIKYYLSVVQFNKKKLLQKE